ncbi:MFS transporter [Williamsia muralis]|uniref:MFS transporter n=1 Tax=Williamsia marianensis TaxID=85044 RepID=A0A2G3PKU8_WILMA|nr:MFS transporter [Williamsia marianensis]PHV66447.1 MFS transporter [Williamsia marianensis]
MAGSSDNAFGWRFTTPLVISSGLNPINSSIIATALVPIAAAMDVSIGQVAVLVTVLYVASAIAQPAMGRCAEQFGAKKIFVVGALLVIAGGTVGALAGNVAVLVLARVLLGVGTSAGFPASMLMIRQRAANTGVAPGGVLGNLVISSQVTVLLGLPLGGILVSVAGWQATFWINIPIAFVVLAMALKWLPSDPPRIHSPNWREILRALDLAGMCLFGAMLTALVVFLTALPYFEWVSLAVSATCLAGLLLWELKAGHPFIDIRSLIENRALTHTYIRSAGTMLVAYCVMYGLTQWLQEAQGLSATVTGLLVVPMSIAGALITRPVSRRNLVRAPLLASAVIAIITAIGLRLLNTGTSPAFSVALTAVAGLAIGLASIGNQSAVFAQARSDETGTAAGLLRTSTYVGAIASGSIIGVVFQDGATDSGLHSIADILITVTIVVLALTVFDRKLPNRL